MSVKLKIHYDISQLTTVLTDWQINVLTCNQIYEIFACIHMYVCMKRVLEKNC